MNRTHPRHRDGHLDQRAPADRARARTGFSHRRMHRARPGRIETHRLEVHLADRAHAGLVRDHIRVHRAGPRDGRQAWRDRRLRQQRDEERARERRPDRPHVRPIIQSGAEPFESPYETRVEQHRGFRDDQAAEEPIGGAGPRFESCRAGRRQHGVDVAVGLGQRRAQVDGALEIPAEAFNGGRSFSPFTFSPGSLPSGDACSISAFNSAPMSTASADT